MQHQARAQAARKHQRDNKPLSCGPTSRGSNRLDTGCLRKKLSALSSLRPLHPPFVQLLSTLISLSPSGFGIAIWQSPVFFYTYIITNPCAPRTRTTSWRQKAAQGPSTSARTASRSPQRCSAPSASSPSSTCNTCPAPQRPPQRAARSSLHALLLPATHHDIIAVPLCWPWQHTCLSRCGVYNLTRFIYRNACGASGSGQAPVCHLKAAYSALHAVQRLLCCSPSRQALTQRRARPAEARHATPKTKAAT